MHGTEDTGVGEGRTANFGLPMTTEDRSTSPLGPVLLAWLLPGAGHLRLGRPWPALFVALGVIPLFVLGMSLTGWENVSWERHPFYFALHAPAGLPAFVGAALTRDLLPDRLMPHAAVGALYSAVAGLLNLMAVADVWARTRRGDPETATAATAASDGDADGRTDAEASGA